MANSLGSLMLKQGTTPDVIPNGSMLMSIRHNTLDIRVIDSVNFLPITLAKPAAFGVSELKKGYFAHLFNTRENQTYVGVLPDPKYYSPDSMATTGRLSFLAWHKKHERDTLAFSKKY